MSNAVKRAELKLSYCKEISRICARRANRIERLHDKQAASEEEVETYRLDLLAACLEESLAEIDLEEAKDA